MTLHYHAPAMHTSVYPTGYCSDSVWIDVGLKDSLIVIVEMDAESAEVKRQAIFSGCKLVEAIYGWRPKDRRSGRFVKRVRVYPFKLPYRPGGRR